MVSVSAAGRKPFFTNTQVKIGCGALCGGLILVCLGGPTLPLAVITHWKKAIVIAGIMTGVGVTAMFIGLRLLLPDAIAQARKAREKREEYLRAQAQV